MDSKVILSLVQIFIIYAFFKLMHVIDFLKIHSLRAIVADRSSSSQNEEKICYAPSTIDVSEFVTNYSHELMKKEQEKIQNLLNSKKPVKIPKRSSLIENGFKEWTSLLQEQETNEIKKDDEVMVPLPPGKTAISVLQEMMQKRGASVPIYKTKGGAGPPFTIVCQIDDMRLIYKPFLLMRRFCRTTFVFRV